MKKGYAIVFDAIEDSKKMEALTEAIRSNFVSKRAKEYMFIIAIENEMTTKEIFDLITAKSKFEPSIMVIRYEYFYGLFLDNDVVEWLRVQFPGTNWYYD